MHNKGGGKMKVFILALWMGLSSIAFPEYQQQTVRNVYTTTSVTTAAFVTLVSSAPYTINNAFISDTSGQTLGLYTGASGSEILQTLIPMNTSGGQGQIPFPCPKGTRISIKALSANATTGELDITFH